MLAAAVGAAVFVYTMPQVQKELGKGKRGRAAGDMPVPVALGEAKVADVPVFLTGVGTARARNTVTVRPQVDGRIISINFAEGQNVKKGDVLAKIDPATYQASFDQALAKKALDEAQLANAERDLERYARLSNLAVAEKTLDTQRALVNQLKAQIKQDDAVIASARATLDYTTIVAPIDGRTGIRQVDVGNLVRGADATIVTITEIQPLAVVFTLPQQQLGKVNAGLRAGPVPVEVLDSDARTVLDRGTLQVVDNQVDQSTGTVRLKAEIPNQNLQLWPGQFVNVRVLIDTLKNVVVVPGPAVQRGPTGAFAYVAIDGKAALRPLKVGMQTEQQAVIEMGVNAGERVVTTGFARLKDGARITVPDESAPQAPNAPGRTPGPALSSSAGKSEQAGRFRSACGADVVKLCPDVERSRDALRACLQSKKDQLSPACRDLVSLGQRQSREADARTGTATK